MTPPLVVRPVVAGPGLEAALGALRKAGVGDQRLRAWCAAGQVYVLSDLALDPAEPPLGAAVATYPAVDGTVEIVAVTTAEEADGLRERLIDGVGDLIRASGASRLVDRSGNGLPVTKDL